MSFIKDKNKIENQILPKALKYYFNAEFSVQQKVRFLYYLLFSFIALMIIVIFYTAYLQLINPIYGTLYFPILLPEIAVLFIIVICYFLVISGYYNIAVHLFYISAISIVWTIVWLDRDNAISKLDTIVFLMAVLTMMPLLSGKYRFTVFIYVFVNILLLFVSLIFLKDKLQISETTAMDIMADYSISFIFIGIVSYSISLINKRINEKAISDFEKKVQTEQALKESEINYYFLMDNMNEVLMIVDNENKINYVNKKFTEKLGYESTEIIGKIGYNYLYSEDEKAIIEHAPKLNKGDVNQYEIAFASKNGKKMDFLITASQIFNPDESSKGYILALVDITDRKIAESALKESELKYRKLFENAQIGIYRTTPSGQILDVNPAILQITGFNSIDEIQQINLESGELIVGSTRTKFKEEIEKFGRVTNFESEWKNKKGETIYIIENSQAIKGKEGNTLYYDGFVENITERKKAEMELKESEMRYRTIIEAFPDLLTISDFSGKIVFMNKVAQKITGITEEHFSNPTKVANIHPEDISMVAKELKELINGNKKHAEIVENRFIDSQGKMHWFSGIMSRIVLNKQPMIQTISRDITEKKANEIELEKYRNHLEVIVKDRTEELSAINEELKMSNEELLTQRELLEQTLENLKLTQNQLVQSEKMASIGILAAGVAHEINNPLNFINGGIIGLENWLEENIPDKRSMLEPLLNGMNEGIRRASAIVKGLNRYSRKNDSISEKCEIPVIIDSCLAMLNSQINEKIEINKNYTSNYYCLKGDEGKLHQAFLNILVNAIQAIENKGTISISSKLEFDQIIITIEDSGEGIKEEHLNKIMDPFFTTKDTGKGTGLGLSITYNIIKDHKGTIEFESKLGKGTKTIIKLPVKTQEDEK